MCPSSPIYLVLRNKNPCYRSPINAFISSFVSTLIWHGTILFLSKRLALAIPFSVLKQSLCPAVLRLHISILYSTALLILIPLSFIRWRKGSIHGSCISISELTACINLSISFISRTLGSSPPAYTFFFPASSSNVTSGHPYGSIVLLS